MQVMDRAGKWIAIDYWRLGKSGIIRDTVFGPDPGPGRYRVIVVTGADIVAKSNVARITWLPPSA
jgi:hypothetical protein